MEVLKTYIVEGLLGQHTVMYETAQGFFIQQTKLRADGCLVVVGLKKVTNAMAQVYIRGRIK
jgi:hypothetical protein